MKKAWLYTFLFIIPLSVAAQNSADTLFEPARILDFHFHFEQEGWLDFLYKTQESKTYIPGNVTINGTFYKDVGVRFKGTSSFYGYPGHKKSWRIKFNEFSDQTFYGLKRINLNNGWSDPTMLREKLYLDFLREQGIPAPRANFARVYIDSVYWGLYSLVEHVDKTFLKNRFAENDGNLYKAGKLADLSWRGTEQENYYACYALKTNEKTNDWSDLVELIDKINHTNPEQFSSELEAVLNTNSFIRAWAANNLFINLDSYLGSANNYYIYHHQQTARFEWIVWDVNLAFGARTGKDTLNLFYDPGQRPLVEKMLASDAYRKTYIKTMNDLKDHFSEEYFFPKIDSLFHLIAEDYLADTLKMYSDEEVWRSFDENLGAIPGLRPFIGNRRKDINTQLEDLISNLPAAEKRNNLQGFQLLQNYPNPFNPTTAISYWLSAFSNVDLSVYNRLGQKVTTLVAANQAAGNYRVSFDASTLPSGIYYYRLSTGSFVQVRKMVLIQ